MAEEKETKEKPQLQVVQVAKELEERIQTPEGELLNTNEFLVWLGAKVLKIEKAVV